MSEEKISKLGSRYTEYYKKKNQNFAWNNQLWPTEFLTRALLGKKLFSPPKSSVSRALDIGFGDGRNFALLSTLFTEVYGLEISTEICDLARQRFPNINMNLGFSHRTGLESSRFDLVVSIHALYYAHLATFDEIIAECTRLLIPCGRLIFSVPKSTSYLLVGATFHPSEYATITRDPLDIRNGIKIKYFSSGVQIINLLSSFGFHSVEVGSVSADWWGLSEDYWIVSARLQ